MEHGALVDRALDGERALHLGGEALRQREPEPGALDARLLGAEPLERPEHQRELFGRDARAGVGHFDLDLVAIHAGTDRRRAAVAVVLHGVGQQVEQDLAEPLPVGEDVDSRAARRLEIAMPRLAAIGRIRSSACSIASLTETGSERQREMSRLDPGDVEHFVDQAQQVLAAAQDVVDAVGLIGVELVEVEELREPHDRVERRAQVVAHAREELALGAVGAIGFVAGALQFLVRGEQFPRPLDDARFELRVELPQLTFGGGAPAAFVRFANRALDGRRQLVEPVLEHVVGGAALQSLDGSLFANRTRDEHERHVRAARPRQVLRLVAAETREWNSRRESDPADRPAHARNPPDIRLR